MPEATKVCPDCAETVKAPARVCRCCGFRFDENDATFVPLPYTNRMVIAGLEAGRASGVAEREVPQLEAATPGDPPARPGIRDHGSAVPRLAPKAVGKWRAYVPLFLIVTTIGIIFTPTVFLKIAGKTVGDQRLLGRTVPLVETSFWNAVPVGRWFVISGLTLAALICWSVAGDVKARNYSKAQDGVSVVYLLTFIAIAIILVRAIFPPSVETAFPEWPKIVAGLAQAIGLDPSAGPRATTGIQFWIFVWPVVFCWLALNRLNRRLRRAMVTQNEQPIGGA